MATKDMTTSLSFTGQELAAVKIALIERREAIGEELDLAQAEERNLRVRILSDRNPALKEAQVKQLDEIERLREKHVRLAHLVGEFGNAQRRLSDRKAKAEGARPS